ncbi:MAG: YbjQ family protein [Candidatus Accumulibacter sp.]|jgi:uncharacterized protein YbjQ (UPF0145 family)|nr:YbjQ family protein [Accumulibacter sp.]
MEDLIAVGVTVVLLVVAYFFGVIGEKKHYSSIRAREAELSGILIFNEKMPPALYAGHEFALVSGSVVMSSDYFRQMIAALKKLFGGRLTSFESMMDRGRREAILRMKEEAVRIGAKVIFNVRLETCMLTKNQGGGGQQGLACAELFAYGTALRARDLPQRKSA